MASFMKRLLGTLLLSLAACFGGGPGLPIPTRPGDLNAKEIQTVTEVTSREAWQNSGFYRIGDETIELPVLIALATDRTLCIIDGRTWASLRQGQRYRCQTSWRMRRA
jgi:hypothetical protein